MEKISHHYVPQFYLRKFSQNKKSIGMYINKLNKYVKNASIKSQACKDHLYGRDCEIENALMALETEAARIIQNIIEKESMPTASSNDYTTLLVFILIMEARVQKEADSWDNFINKQSKIMLRMYKEKNRIDISDKDFDKFDVKLDIPNLVSIKNAARNYWVLEDLAASLIKIDNDRTFITSDNPITRYNYNFIIRNYCMCGFGLAHMGIQIFFPISPKYCIYIYDDTIYNTGAFDSKKIILKKAKYVDEMNKLFHLDSYDFIFFNNRQSRKDILRIVDNYNHSSEVEKEVQTLGLPLNQLIMFRRNFVREKINFPFVRINKQFLNMTFPKHSAGPIRPIVREKEKRLNMEIK